MAEEAAFTYDWQAESETSFLKWLLPHLLTGEPLDKQMDELSKATKKFTEVTLTLQVNGIDVPAKQFLDSVHANMTNLAERGAEERLGAMAGFEDLREQIDLLSTAMRERVRRLAEDVGLDLSDPYA